MALSVPTLLLGLFVVARGSDGNSDDEPADTTPTDNDLDSFGPEMLAGTPPPGDQHLIADGHADPCQPALDTPFLNDELCIAVPDPEVGLQLHFGPDDPGDYDNPDAIAPYLLEPGGEDVVCQFRTTSNTEEKFTMESHTRLRTGTHHMILWGAVGDAPLDPPDGTFDATCSKPANYIFQTGAQAALGSEGFGFYTPGDGGNWGCFRG